jgi:hypothetical protein
MRIVCALTSLLVLLFICTSASAAIQPSFLSEESSWRATDIVLVTEEKQIDGNFRILEVWKGQLRVGQRITVRELAEFKTSEARLIENWPEGKTSEYVTGEKMILFLRDANKVSGDPDRHPGQIIQPPKTNSHWKSANPMGQELKYSTVWIENGKVYGFVQLMNPGPSVLHGLGITEADLKEEVSRVSRTEECLDAALAITDPDTRAQCLEPFARDVIFLARDRSFAALTECGEAALPVLRRMLNEEPTTELHGQVIEAFASAGRKAAGPELTAWLERELEFWKQTAPGLHVGWWNGAGFGSVQYDAIKAVEPFRSRWSVLLHAVYALGSIRYDGAERVLIELSDYWRSMPQLYDDQVSEACDDVLRYLGSTRKDGKRPRLPEYEVSFSGNKVFSSALLTEKMSEYVSAYDELERDYEERPGDNSLSYARDRLREFISSQGYLDVNFDWETRATTAGEMICVKIDEGNQYRLGTIRIKGAKVFLKTEIRNMLKLREGDIADGAAIDKWRDDLQKAYSDLGYLDSYVGEEHERRKTPTGEMTDVVDFNITISEGTRYRVASIAFEGKTEIKKAQLSAAMRLREGAIFLQKRLDDSIRELNKLGLALEQDMDVGVFPEPRSESVRIVIVLNKARRPEDSFNRFVMKRRWYL